MDRNAGALSLAPGINFTTNFGALGPFFDDQFPFVYAAGCVTLWPPFSFCFATRDGFLFLWFPPRPVISQQHRVTRNVAIADDGLILLLHHSIRNNRRLFVWELLTFMASLTPESPMPLLKTQAGEHCVQPRGCSCECASSTRKLCIFMERAYADRVALRNLVFL